MKRDVERSEIPQKSGRIYDFKSAEIIRQLEQLTSFFQQKRLAPDTIRIHRNYVGYFLEWLKSQNIVADKTGYNDLLNFVGYCRRSGRSSRNINQVLTSVRYYFDMLVSSGQLKNNPGGGLYVRGETKSIPNNLLDPDQLDKLYEQYPVYNERTQRNKVITGLYVYQGIGTDELKKLEPQHIKLKAGKIYIPGTKQTYNKAGRKGRWLKLKANQILELQEYLLVTRPKIIGGLKAVIRQGQEVPKRIGMGRKPDKINWAVVEQRLFMSLNGSRDLRNSVRHLMDDLRKINPEVKDAQQIRRSVIVNWLKEKDIRQVQYMAGHSSVSSTERYRAANLEELEEALKLHHPLS